MAVSSLLGLLSRQPTLSAQCMRSFGQRTVEAVHGHQGSGSFVILCISCTGCQFHFMSSVQRFRDKC